MFFQVGVKETATRTFYYHDALCSEENEAHIEKALLNMTSYDLQLVLIHYITSITLRHAWKDRCSQTRKEMFSQVVR